MKGVSELEAAILAAGGRVTTVNVAALLPAQATAAGVKAADDRPPPLATRVDIRVRITGLRLASEANAGGQRGAAIARKQAVKAALALAKPWAGLPAFALPVVVTFTRLGGKELDADDNLPMCFKTMKDVIAEDWLGLPNDRDKRVSWRYRQAAAWSHGCEIRIRTRRTL